MDRKRSYRILLSCCLAAVLFLLAFFIVKEADDALPDYVNLVQGTEERFESAVPVTLTTESALVECSAASQPSPREGALHKTTVSIEGKAEGYYEIEASLFGLFPLKSIYVHVTEDRASVVPGGQAVGIYMETDGLLVLGTGTVTGADGMTWEPAANLVQTGDYVLRLNDVELTSKQQMAEEMQKIVGATGLLTLRRNGEIVELEVPVIRAEDGTNKMGIWIRDDTMGIGTLTYVAEDGSFGALGHPITDSDTGTMMELETGELYPLGLLTVRKGVKGEPGKLSGIVLRSEQEKMGEISFNSAKGIYGAMKEVPENFDTQSYPIAWKQEIEEGMATILSGISGEIKEYAVVIEEIVLNPKNTNKGMEIRVVDENLLELTGGIVQGMSGSPILQDGKIVGAVTHVLVDDPTRGYGIFIENMLDAAD